jgi:chemotaxis protein methyltransferase CheR
MEELEIDIQGLRNIVATVKELYGFDFSNYAMSSFKRRISRILQLFNFKGIDDLVERLKADSAFYEIFLKEVTVNTTEMFRDPSFWRKMRNQVLPLYENQEKIKIWHSACSSGEEVFSMCILLKESGLLEKAEITATDINEDVLKTAKSGNYHIRSLELNTNNYQRFEGKRQLADYYSTQYDRVVFNPSLIQGVTYKTHDLVLGSPFELFDIILCRNVMIYFNQQLQENVLQLFIKSLKVKGFLAIGAKETISWCKGAEQFSVFDNEDKIYRKARD